MATFSVSPTISFQQQSWGMCEGHSVDVRVHGADVPIVFCINVSTNSTVWVS